MKPHDDLTLLQQVRNRVEHGATLAQNLEGAPVRINHQLPNLRVDSAARLLRDLFFVGVID